MDEWAKKRRIYRIAEFGPAYDVLKCDRCQHLGRLLAERLANSKETFDTRQVRAAFDGADLRNGEFRGGAEILEGPIPFGA